MLNMQQQFDVPASCLAADGIACCSLVWSMCKCNGGAFFGGWMAGAGGRALMTDE